VVASAEFIAAADQPRIDPSGWGRFSVKTACNGRLIAAVLVALASACSSFTAVPPTGGVSVTSDVLTIKNDGTKANLTVKAVDAAGKAGTGTVSLQAPYGDVNGTGTTSATLTLDSTGSAKATYACNVTAAAACIAGPVALTATWTTLSGSALLTITSPSGTGGTDGGTGGGADGGVKVAGPPTIIIETAAAPAILGLKGSGIQESGLMTFLVTDAQGTPAPGAAVTFGQALPNLVTLSNTTATSDANGNAVVAYTSGPEVGVSSITATLTATGAIASHPVAVRGAKPSGSGFYFHCAQANLPVYTTTDQHQTTTCTVRLSDRFGNRVGVPTPVFFAAEAGAISASAMTQAFDPTKPTDPGEGSVTVTFSSDFGNGFMPVDTTPLAASAGQFPFARVVEPSNGAFNPRDQFVTIIAMVRGEEAFVDANHNGAYDPGELFVDEGDPYIDSNDNNQYDGATEVRFCEAANCSAYHGPNGVWDANTTIWVPTWVVFTGNGGPVVTAPSPACLDYTDNNNLAAFGSIVSAAFVDQWLNPPGPGTTFSILSPVSGQSGLKLTLLGNSSPALDGWGAMGVLHVNFDWIQVAGSDAVAGNTACTLANTTTGACVQKLVFYNWDSGLRTTAEIDNTNKTPPAPATNPGHACGASPTTGSHLANYIVQATSTQGGVTLTGSAPGTFGY
jgi:hypothetical protein